MSNTTNADRAESARIALETYIKVRGNGDDVETDAKDLVTDLCHMLNLELDDSTLAAPIREFLDSAYNNFVGEVDDELEELAEEDEACEEE